MAETQYQHPSVLGEIIARAWRDPDFKSRLLADPRAALQEAGVAVPGGMTVTVVENTATHLHLILPQSPSDEMSEADLDGIAGGHENPLADLLYSFQKVFENNKIESR